MRRRLIPVAMLVMALAGPVLAQQTVNLRDADVRAYIQDVARATGRTFIIDPRVQGKVSVVSERPLGREAYFELFLSTLRANGLVVSPASGGAYRVAPAENAASQPALRGGADSFVTEAIRLESIDAASAVESLRPLVSREGQLTANRAGNSVIIADYADNVRRVRGMLRAIDRARLMTQVVPLKHAGAREIAAALRDLTQAARGADAAAAVGIVPIDSSNSVALRGEPSMVAEMARTVSQLDGDAANGSDVRVVFLKHADAQMLLPVLQQLVGQAVTTAATSAPLPASNMAGSSSGTGSNTASGTNQNQSPIPPAISGAAATGPVPGATIGAGRAVISRFEGANAIVIAAPAEVQRQLGEVIRQLDVRREQVLVEAIIVEISDLAAQRLGVQFLLSGTGGSNIPFAATNYSNAAPNLLSITGAVVAERELGSDNPTTQALRESALASILGANGGTFGFGGNLTSNSIFGVVLNAVKADTASNVLSTPSIMTLDNQQARILVGQDIPITTGEALSNNFDNAFRTIQRQNVGVQLDVRPQINAGGTITMVLRQEVSSIAGPVSNTSSELILNKREISTTVSVDDGEIIALGGLIDENERRTLEKIPFLGDIPLLGNFFRSRSNNSTKTNLMVFIRPTIVKTTADAARIAGERYEYMNAAEAAASAARGEKGGDSALDALVRDYLRAAPPTSGTLPPPVPPVPGPVPSP
ncbi:type II secretion system secretin GspD [Polymorphobacter sp.]|uniref:type II secretion system secretin GspD n=1 Tax=Polymorphobacter sp. TaxID=1909290 RepID=UPI003F6F5216